MSNSVYESFELAEEGKGAYFHLRVPRISKAWVPFNPSQPYATGHFRYEFVTKAFFDAEQIRLKVDQGKDKISYTEERSGKTVTEDVIEDCHLSPEDMDLFRRAHEGMSAE